MDVTKRISKVFNSSKEITFDKSSKFALMSDCHRGDGSWADDFARNSNLFNHALNHYYKNGYTYIELGDGDELWENRKLDIIIEAHSDTFQILSKFYNEGRLYFIFGNHDIVKRNKNFVKKNLYNYYNELENEYMPLFPNIKIHEGLILKHSETNNKILLTHGHQVDYLNYDLWRLARFLVRYFWRILELIGVNDPIRRAKNHKNKDLVARRLINWVIREEHMLISGHNHRPMFPRLNEPPYFNCGSCVHPRCITAIEIVYENIMLVKWCTKVKDDGTLFISKDILAGPKKLEDFFIRLSSKKY